MGSIGLIVVGEVHGVAFYNGVQILTCVGDLLARACEYLLYFFFSTGHFGQ